MGNSVEVSLLYLCLCHNLYYKSTICTILRNIPLSVNSNSLHFRIGIYESFQVFYIMYFLIIEQKILVFNSIVQERPAWAE